MMWLWWHEHHRLRFNHITHRVITTSSGLGIWHTRDWWFVLTKPSRLWQCDWERRRALVRKTVGQ